MSLQLNELPDRWKRHCEDPEPSLALAEWITTQTKLLATPSSGPARLQVAQLNEQSGGGVWTVLDKAWSEALCLEQDTPRKQIVVETAVKSLRLARNAVAGCQPNQLALYAHVDSVVKLLHQTTSLASINDELTAPMTLAAVQLLSNMVTLNDDLQSRFWVSYVIASVQGGIICRLLASPSSPVLSATQVLLLNCVRFSRERSHSLSTSQSGAAILSHLLMLADSAVSEDEDSPSEELLAEKLSILYPLFTHLFSQRLLQQMYDMQAASHSVETSDPLFSRLPHVSPTQLILLKLFDAYIHHGAEDLGRVEDSSGDDSTLLYLTALFLRLAGLAQDAMTAVLESEKRDGDGADESLSTPGVNASTAPDTRLAALHQSLILVLQCLGTVGRAAMDEPSPELPRAAFRDESLRTLSHMRTEPFVGPLISFVRTLTRFAPPVSPFSSTASTAGPLPPDHALSSTGLLSSTNAGAGDATTATQAPRRRGLANLKRDTVRLLGVLAYRPTALSSNVAQSPSSIATHRQGVKFVQDLVRERGALLDVLGLTNLDEENPYIREHAIFALRNVLDQNAASQEFIASLRHVDSEGNPTTVETAPTASASTSSRRPHPMSSDALGSGPMQTGYEDLM